MTTRAIRITALATGALLLASCGTNDGRTTSPSPLPEQGPPSVLAPDNSRIFNADELELAVADLGVVCHGDWKRVEPYNDCIDPKYPDAWFAIVDPPDYDTMRSRTWGAQQPATSIWNDEVGFVYPDSWAGEWLDPFIEDCIAGASDCYMQSGQDDPILVND